MKRPLAAAALAVALACLCAVSTQVPPNIIVILADDLGYGDLSLAPFNASGISTPELALMARKGTVLTNFHVAAPICTPSRAAILSGLFPWRLGIHSIFGTGTQSGGHMLVVDSIPNILAARGYHTAHVGKWHLGGMKPTDLDARRRFREEGARCPADAHPGPMQHGFAEYIAMPEGPGSARLNEMIPQSTLHHCGAQHLVRNDEPLPASDDILADRQVAEALGIVEAAARRRQPLYLQLWFDAPHGPWELIEPFDRLYPGLTGKMLHYATMVSSMDAAIGRLRRGLRDLGVETNTLLVFLSDNGPEDGAGSAAPFRGGKRSVLEGGLRVPSIWEWPQHIPAGRSYDHFALATDLLPTFAEIAGAALPSGLRFDGRSLTNRLRISVGHAHKALRGAGVAGSDDQMPTFWYSRMPDQGAARFLHLKLVDILNGESCLFNVTSDPTEQHCLRVRSASFRDGAFVAADAILPARMARPHRVLAESLQHFITFGSHAFEVDARIPCPSVCGAHLPEQNHRMKWPQSKSSDLLACAAAPAAISRSRQ